MSVLLLPFSELSLPPQIDVSAGFDRAEPGAWTIYKRDFPDNPSMPVIENKTIKIHRRPHPANQTREFTYWHMITHDVKKGVKDESSRIPDTKRLEKIPWARPLLSNYSHPDIKRWRSVKHGKWSWYVWHAKLNYLLVLRDDYDGLLLSTAYCPAPENIKDYHTQWADAKKARHTF